MMRKTMIGLLMLGAAAIATPRPANAHVSVAIGLPGFGLFVGAPLVYGPPVAYVPPPPVVYAPPPVVYGPAYYPRPVYYGAYGYRPGWHRGWHGRHW